ncbi:hypothetical protein SAMN05443245_0420 [Paraburkholderia fungorum]|uniref:Transmembrane protein n=1 Tax=Paraburkholderia fungorum TaxID=134537 RepID=A0A1H0Z2W6_9BURK|nr:hypothetical protein SAMN05443245_0420 [Paraburkholderia fungorum]
MKRVWGSLLAVAIGFAVALRLGDSARWNPWPEKSYHGCYEIDACNVPWWLIAVFVLWLVGPPVIYGCVAYVGIGRKWSAMRWLVTGSTLLLGTITFYISWYAYRAFI